MIIMYSTDQEYLNRSTVKKFLSNRACCNDEHKLQDYIEKSRFWFLEEKKKKKRFLEKKSLTCQGDIP